ncbi:MAG TPA: DUF445 family protein [Candidatus Binataceae bacterium]|nr:DUF445 family protein [Candidatus Binataceae bacterium]
MDSAQVIGAPRAPATWNEFIFSRKGDLALLLSAVAYALGWIILRLTALATTGEIVLAMAQAALVGGLCDYIALKMIFERRWYLPNSGVLPRNRVKLIDGIAVTIEKEWLTPEMIGRKLGEMDLAGRAGAYLEQVRIEEVLGSEAVEHLISRATAALGSKQALERLDAILRKVLPKTFTRIYAALNKVGVRPLSARIVANLRHRLPELRDDPELMNTLEGAVHELGAELRKPDSFAHQKADAMMAAMVRRAVEASRGQITQMVKDNLARLTDDQIRFQIESKTRTHLDWIRVNGGLFGALFGLGFELSRLAALHGPAIIARLESVR